jgi:hypothetical protein
MAIKAKHTLWIGNQPEPADRTQIDVSPKDYRRVGVPKNDDGTGRVKVKDLRTGNTVTLRSENCGLDCRCALAFAD